jgi:hypothetical protein
LRRHKQLFADRLANFRSARTVAAANRTARVAWAIMTRGGTYRAPIGAAA